MYRIDRDSCDWAEYNDRHSERLLDRWDSGEAVREIIAPVGGVTTGDVCIADSVTCPRPSGEVDERQ